MTPLDVRIPPGATISNYLYPMMKADDLTQDVVAISLHNGYFVDVGWYPEHDLDGRFIVRVFAADWDCQQIAPPPLETRDVQELITAVEELAERFSREQPPAIICN